MHFCLTFTPLEKKEKKKWGDVKMNMEKWRNFKGKKT
jgi:hypothetical protein